MKIYTKTGDKGETSVIGGRISKNSKIISAIGTFDELNATIGLAISLNTSDDKYKETLIDIQNMIFCIGSFLSGAKLEVNLKIQTEQLELDIDNLTKNLPELTNFILPGGHIVSAQIHVARTICRRAERELHEYIQKFEIEKPKQMKVEESALIDIQKYINRLSDYLFTLARFINYANNIPDSIWQKPIDK